MAGIADGKILLERNLIGDIVRIGRENGIREIVLFGSRARGDNSERSDIDLAVRGENTLDFYYDLEEQAKTLLMFDVVDLDDHISNELKDEIECDGVVLYEQKI